MKIISWNLNARVGKAAAQCEALAGRSPDVIAVQEVTATTLPIIRSALSERGFRYLVDSLSTVRPRNTPRGPRRYGVAIASVEPLHRLKPIRVPWMEKTLSASVSRRNGRLHVCTAHIPPGSSNDWTKIEVLEGIYQALARHSRVPRILTGDFNTPQSESEAGEVVTWGQWIDECGKPSIWGKFKGGTGIRWDSAERQILTGLATFDLCDVFRRVRGYGCQEFSWYLKRGGRAVGRRFDHVFASAAIKPVRCDYIHDFRTSGLSDHAAIEAEFAI